MIDLITVAGGGCGILVNKNIKYKEIELKLNMDTEKIESVWIELSDFNIYVCGFYRSQNFTPKIFFWII